MNTKKKRERDRCEREHSEMKFPIGIFTYLDPSSIDRRFFRGLSPVCGVDNLDSRLIHFIQTYEQQSRQSHGQFFIVPFTTSQQRLTDCDSLRGFHRTHVCPRPRASVTNLSFTETADFGLHDVEIGNPTRAVEG